MTSTIPFLLKRIGGALLTLLAVSIVTFALTRVIPGNPGVAILGQRATPEIVERINREFGLDRPLVSQYWTWLTSFVSGDLGHSLASVGTGEYTGGEAVSSIVRRGLEVTIPVTVFGMGIGLALGVAMGTVAAARKGKPSDHAISTVSLAGISAPDFFIAFLLLLVFAVRLKWLPSVGFTKFGDDPAQWLRTLILPSLAIGLINSAAIARVTRNAVIDALESDSVFVARSRGTPASVVVVKHALRTALMPIATLAGLQFGYLLGGVVVIENMFALPGMGRSLLLAVNQRDYPTIQALIIVFAAAFIVINLVVDLTYPVLDPRVR